MIVRLSQRAGMLKAGTYPFMKNTQELSYRILVDMDGQCVITDIIRWHHERAFVLWTKAFFIYVEV